MKELITSILGHYELQTAENGNVIGGIAGLDWSWIVGGCLLLLFTYCLFRLVGEVFK